MDERLLHAARTGDCEFLSKLRGVDDRTTVLDGRTTQGNSCLHIAVMCGQKNFCSEVVSLQPSVLSAINSDGETPLLTAVKANRSSVAKVLHQKYLDNHLNEDLQRQDRHGCNVLHHAIRSGLRELTLELIENSPAALSYAVNHKGESPIFMAVLRRDFKDVYMQLLGILPGSAVTDDVKYSGTCGSNALHAAVKYDQKGET
jgi:ankyrin repeat protein